MPKLVYSISKTKAELERNRLSRDGRGQAPGCQRSVLLGSHKKSGKPALFTVFDFLEKALTGKAFGSRATYTVERASGWVGYVYESAHNNYFLVEKRHFPLGGGNPRIEKVPMPNCLQPKKV